MKKLTQMIGTFVLVFFGCMVIFALFSGNDEDAPAVMSTAAATPDLMQFVNTPTPAPPTSTPPPVDNERAEYLAKVGGQGDMLVNGMSQLGVLLGDANFADQDWRLQVAVSMGMMRAAHETLSGITPPADLESLHLRITDATEDCNDATVMLARGLDNIDPALINEAGALIIRCTDKMNAITADLR